MKQDILRTSSGNSSGVFLGQETLPSDPLLWAFFFWTAPLKLTPSFSVWYFIYSGFLSLSEDVGGLYLLMCWPCVSSSLNVSFVLVTLCFQHWSAWQLLNKYIKKKMKILQLQSSHTIIDLYCTQINGNVRYFCWFRLRCFWWIDSLGTKALS